MLVAHQRGVAHQQPRLQLALDGLRSDHLAAAGLQHLLLAVGDGEEPIRIDLADVSGAEPPILGKRRRRLVRLVPVAVEDRRPAHLQLAVRREARLDIR